MGDNDPDVRIKLMLDDGATKDAVEGMKRGLHDSNEELKEGKEHAHSMLSELLKFEAVKEGAKLLADGMKQAWEFGEKFAEAGVEASDEMNKQVRAASGLMMFMDKGAHTLAQVRDYATGVREELSKAGTAAGVSTESMMEVYDRIIERGGESTEQAKELAGQMALVGKVVPRGMEGIAEGFNMMELGIVRARNPLVQLIASTGVLKGNVHDVARQMQHMTPDRQIAIAQKAIAQQAELMKSGGANAMPPTMDELKASMGNIREGFEEAVGAPIMERILPDLSALRDYLASHTKEIAELGSEVGQVVERVIEKIEEVFGDVYSGAVRDWREIKNELSAAGQALTEAWREVAGSNAETTRDLKDGALAFASAIRLAADAIRVTVETVKNLWEMMKSPGGMIATMMGGPVGLAAYAAANHSKWGEGVAKDKATNNLVEQAKAGSASTEEFATTVQDYAKVMIDAGASISDVAATVHQAIGDFAQHQTALHIDMLTNPEKYTDSALLESRKRNAPDAIRDIAGHGPTQNFYGGIHIKQDFRDQDPDRIVQVFRRDLANQATNRRQARTAMFGGL